jgi:ABC-type nitrate/sulfonate/bicarbonate transport system permease component
MKLAVRQQLDQKSDNLLSAAGLAVLISVWLILTLGHLVIPLFLPTPKGIWDGLAFFQHQHWLLPAILRSFGRVMIALILVVLIGVPIGVLMGAFTQADAFLRKVINGAKSVPTTGLVGLIVLWAGIEGRGKIAFLFLGAIFYMVILVKNAVQSVNEDYVRVALDLGASPAQIVWRVLIPGALPQIWEAIAVCNGIMWTYIVLAEYISLNLNELGLGCLLGIGSHKQESGQVFAALGIIALVSVLTDFGLRSVQKRYLDW